ncbi:MAG: MFS transporter [Methylocystis sp.]
MPHGESQPLSGWRFLLLNIVLGVGNVVVLSNVPGYTILGPYAASNLQGVTPSFGSWATTDHMIGLALGFPLARWFGARFGAHRALVSAYALYALFSFVCAMSETIYFFVAARILLGFAGGVILPIGQSVLLNEYPEKARTFGVGLWGLLSMMPFMVGIFMGGWWVENFGWRSMFYSNIPVALLAAGVTGSLLYGRKVRPTFRRFDLVGFLLLAAILFASQTIFNMGNDFDWLHSPILIGALIVVVLALPCFVIWELGERHPAIDVRLFSHRNYAVATLCSVVGFLVIQGLLSLLIVQLQLLLGYSSSLAGGVYLSMLFLSVPTAAIVHELCKNFDVRLISFLNFLGFAATLTWLGLFDKTASFDQIAWPMTFFGFSLAMFFTPLANLAMFGLQGSRLIRAAEEFALLRTVAGANGIALLAVVLFRRTPYHQLDLSDAFGGRRFAELDLMTQLTDRLAPLGFSERMATGQSGRFLRQQAALLAFNDAFLLGAVVFVVLAAVVWLARATHPPRLTPAQELKQLQAEELMEQP